MKIIFLFFSFGILATIFAQSELSQKMGDEKCQIGSSGFERTTESVDQPSSSNISPLMGFGNEEQKDEPHSSIEATRAHEVAGTGDSPSQLSRGCSTDGIAETTVDGSEGNILNDSLQTNEILVQDPLTARAAASQNQQRLSAASALPNSTFQKMRDDALKQCKMATITAMCGDNILVCNEKKMKSEEAQQNPMQNSFISPILIADGGKTSKIAKLVTFDIPQPSASKAASSAAQKLQNFNKQAKIMYQRKMLPRSEVLDTYFAELFEIDAEIEKKIAVISAEDCDRSSKIAAIYAQAYPPLHQSLEIIINMINNKLIMKDQRTDFYLGAIADYLVDVAFKRINVSNLSEENLFDFNSAYTAYANEREIYRAVMTSPIGSFSSAFSKNNELISKAAVYLQEIACEASKRSDDFVSLTTIQQTRLNTAPHIENLSQTPLL